MSENITLRNCPTGLFVFGATLCFKSEYKTPDGWTEAFVVDSGEFFHGGALNSHQRETLDVYPVTYRIKGLEIVIS